MYRGLNDFVEALFLGGDMRALRPPTLQLGAEGLLVVAEGEDLIEPEGVGRIGHLGVGGFDESEAKLYRRAST